MTTAAADEEEAVEKKGKPLATAAAAEGSGGAKEAAGATAAVSTTFVASADELKFAAVVDPPRSGVHAKCLRSIRSTKAIKRLVSEKRERESVED